MNANYPRKTIARMGEHVNMIHAQANSMIVNVTKARAGQERLVRLVSLIFK